jgi:hypothetical protein
MAANSEVFAHQVGYHFEYFEVGCQDMVHFVKFIVDDLYVLCICKFDLQLWPRVRSVTVNKGG